MVIICVFLFVPKTILICGSSILSAIMFTSTLQLGLRVLETLPYACLINSLPLCECKKEQKKIIIIIGFDIILCGSIFGVAWTILNIHRFYELQHLGKRTPRVMTARWPTTPPFAPSRTKIRPQHEKMASVAQKSPTSAGSIWFLAETGTFVFQRSRLPGLGNRGHVNSKRASTQASTSMFVEVVWGFPETTTARSSRSATPLLTMNILRVLLGSALTKPQPTASDLNVVHTISRAGSELKPVFLDVSALQPFGPWGPLPKDIWTIIFGFMEVKNLRRLLFVNKSFARQTVVTFLKVKIVLRVLENFLLIYWFWFLI